MENLQQLQKLSKVINTDKIISPEDIQEVITALVAVLANNKKSVEALNQETKDKVEELLAYLEAEHSKMLERMEEAGSNTQKISSEMEGKLAQTLEACKAVMEEMKQIKPLDGKDADEERVITEVLAKIKLPEYKEVVLDGGEEIVNKINDLEIEPEKQIDAVHIKNLPKEVQKYSYAVQRNLAWYDESTLLLENPTKIKFTGAGVQATLDSEGTVVVTINGGAGASEAYEDATNTGNDLDFTISNTPVANTLLVINGNTGQIFMPTTDYTLSGTTITFVNAQPGVTVRARYAYS